MVFGLVLFSRTGLGATAVVVCLVNQPPNGVERMFREME
jgi:hypothetical protein